MTLRVGAGSWAPVADWRSPASLWSGTECAEWSPESEMCDLRSGEFPEGHRPEAGAARCCKHSDFARDQLSVRLCACERSSSESASE